MLHPGQWTFGSTSVTRIIESEGPLLSPFELFAECTPAILEENRPWLMPRFLDPASSLLQISIQSFLIRQHGLTILVDACSGNHKHRARPFFNQREWPWMERLRAAGVLPEQIDVVLCTHLHVDHVGWNTRLENGSWVPTFPNARYLIAEKEWDYWRSPAASLARTGDYISDSVLPVFASGQAELISPATEPYLIDAGIHVELAPGHTPGQCMVRLGPHQGGAVLCSDLMHHPLQIRYPSWSTNFCVDKHQALETRRRFLAQYANTNTMIFPAHFPTPCGGFLVSERASYGFIFDGESEPALQPDPTAPS